MAMSHVNLWVDIWLQSRQSSNYNLIRFPVQRTLLWLLPDGVHSIGKMFVSLVTLAGTAQYTRVLRQSRYCGYCRWVLQGTVGTAGTVQYPQYPWVLQGTVGTVGTARAKVTVGYCGSTRGYCRVLWVLWVLQDTGYCGYCTGYCGYCRCVLQGTAGCT